MSSSLARLVVAILCCLALPLPECLAQEDSGPTSIEGDDWKLEFQSSQWFLDGDVRIVVVQEPRLRSGDREVRATWALGWVDLDGSSPFSRQRPIDLKLGPTQEAVEQAPEVAPSVFSFPLLFEDTTFGLAREIYLEGPVEFFEGGKRVAYADALYLDRVDGHGWIAGANYSFRDRIGGSYYVLKVQADWLRVSADGSLSSKRAKVTTSEFAVPSYYITTGDLELKPTGDPEYPYEVRLRKNGIRIRDTVTLPLPPIDYFANEEGEPSFGGLRVGDSAKFGSVVGFEYSRDLDESFAERVNLWLGGDPSDFRSRVRFDVSYLGSRGLLFDPGLRLNSPAHYTWDMDLALVPDGGSDGGLIQVPKDDRSSFRAWYRSRGRFLLGEKEWVDLTLSLQSDAGVQAEFFEDEYLQYEERESYLHWRRARAADYTSATLAVNLDSFRTEVEELPELEHFRLRQPLLHGKGWSLLHGYETELGYYRREEGSLPFETPFLDGFGETDSLRLHHNQRIEAPLELGLAGLRATPFALLDWTGYSQDGLEEDEVSELAGIGGLRLATTFWRTGRNDESMELTPSLSWREDWLYNRDDEPATFDLLERRRLEGEILELAMRARWTLPNLPLHLDTEVRGEYLGRSEDEDDKRWLPTGVFGSAETQIGSVPVGISHNGLYDLDSDSTDYARTLLNIRPTRKLDLQFGFVAGRDQLGLQLFEAATFGALYRFTPKWDIQASHTFDLNNSDRTLNTEVSILRYGHDLLFELSFQDRTGEGVSIGVGIKPLLSARKRSTSRLALFDRLDQASD